MEPAKVRESRVEDARLARSDVVRVRVAAVSKGPSGDAFEALKLVFFSRNERISRTVREIRGSAANGAQLDERALPFLEQLVVRFVGHGSTVVPPP